MKSKLRTVFGWCVWANDVILAIDAYNDAPDSLYYSAANEWRVLRFYCRSASAQSYRCLSSTRQPLWSLATLHNEHCVYALLRTAQARNANWIFARFELGLFAFVLMSLCARAQKINTTFQFIHWFFVLIRNPTDTENRIDLWFDVLRTHTHAPAHNFLNKNDSTFAFFQRNYFVFLIIFMNVSVRPENWRTHETWLAQSSRLLGAVCEHYIYFSDSMWYEVIPHCFDSICVNERRCQQTVRSKSWRSHNNRLLSCLCVCVISVSAAFVPYITCNSVSTTEQRYAMRKCEEN